MHIVLKSNDTKNIIRRRLFLEAVRNGEREPKYGFQICDNCGGRGSVCIEHIEGDRHVAALEACTACNGETIVPTRAQL